MRKKIEEIIEQSFDVVRIGNKVYYTSKSKSDEKFKKRIEKLLTLTDVSKWHFLATTKPKAENKYYTVLDKYGNVEENVLFGCSGFMGEPYSFFDGDKIASKDIIAFC